jgi:hypothetical protein
VSFADVRLLSVLMVLLLLGACTDALKPFDADKNASQISAACMDTLKLDQPFALHAIGIDPLQIHLYSLYADETLWLAYNIRNANPDNAYANTALLGLYCDGGVRVEETVVNVDESNNHTDPLLSVHGGRLLLAWQSDTLGLSPQNLDVHFRLYDTFGQSLTSGDQVLETTVNGVAEGANAWMVAVSPAGSDGFAIAGVRGHSGASGFQAFWQELSTSGALIGETVDLSLEANVGHTYPTLASYGDNILMAWESSENWDGSQIAFTRTVLSDLGEHAVHVTNMNGEAGLPVVGWAPGGVHGFVGFHLQTSSGTRIYLQKAENQAPALRVDSTTGHAHSPALALGENAGLLVWFEIISGLKNRVHYRFFSWDELGNPELGSAYEVSGVVDAAPYVPAITHIDADTFFIGWSQGSSPEFLAHGMFVKAP